MEEIDILEGEDDYDQEDEPDEDDDDDMIGLGGGWGNPLHRQPAANAANDIIVINPDAGN